MCARKDIDVILEQFQHCHDHEEKRRILEQLNSCNTCEEETDTLVKGVIRCRCEVYKHIEFLNTLEHAIQHRVFEK